MKKKYFTVVAECICGCDNDAEIHHVRAESAEKAAAIVRGDFGENNDRVLRVHAVFAGKLKSLTP